MTDKRLNVRMEDTEFTRLKELQTMSGLTQSEVIRELIRNAHITIVSVLASTLAIPADAKKTVTSD